MKTYYLENNLFETHFLENIAETITDFNSNIDEKFEFVKKLYQKEKFKKSKEASLEIDFIHKVLILLGYEFIYRERISFQGQSYEPDNILFQSEEHKDIFIQDKEKLEVVH